MIGKIYKIYCDETNLTYYGSTTQCLSKRLRQHQDCKTTMVRNMENPKIELIEEVDFESRVKLLERERWYIENNECCNKYIPLRTHKEWYEANKEKTNEQKKEYHHANKEKINERHRKHYDANRQEISEKRKENYDKEKKKEHYEKNKKQINERRREKIECECGLIISRGDKARHLKSKKHLDRINSHHQHQ